MRLLKGTRRRIAVLGTAFAVLLTGCGAESNDTGEEPGSVEAESEPTETATESEPTETATEDDPAPAPEPDGSGLVTSISEVEPLPEPVPLRLGYNNNLLNLPLFYLVENGWLEQVGFEVDVTETRGSASAEFPPLLAQNQLDVAQGSPAPSIYNQVAEGFGITIPASLGVERSGRMASGWIVLNPSLEAEVEQLEDLRGLTLEGLAEAAPPGFVARSMIEDAGIADEVDLQFRARSREDQFALIENEAADAYSLPGSLAVTFAERGQLHLWKPWAEVLPWYQPAMLTVSEEFAGNTEALSKFLEVYLLAVRDINSTDGEWRDDLIEISMTYGLVEEESIITAQGGVPYYDPNGDVSMETLERSQDGYLRLGIINSEVDLDQLVDRTALEQALDRVGRE